MGNLINNLPQILEKSASLFGVFALVSIILAFVVFLLFGKAEPKQKERIFVYMTLFFLALTFSALAAGVLSGFKGGGELVTTQIAQDPAKVDSSLVSLSPNTVENLEKYIQSRGEAVTQENKVRVLEEALEAYTNPKPVELPISDPPVSIPSLPSSSQKVEDNDFRFEFQSCQRSGSKVICNLAIINLATADREIQLSASYGRESFSRLIDVVGNEYYAVLSQLGQAQQSAGSPVKVRLIPNIAMKGSLVFENVPQEVNKLAVVDVAYVFPNPYNTYRNVQFRNVDIKPIVR